MAMIFGSKFGWANREGIQFAREGAPSITTEQVAQWLVTSGSGMFVPGSYPVRTRQPTAKLSFGNFVASFGIGFCCVVPVFVVWHGAWHSAVRASVPDLPLASARSDVIRWSWVLVSPTQDAAGSY